MDDLWGAEEFAFELLELSNCFVGGVGCFDNINICPVEYTGSTGELVFVVFSCKNGGAGGWFLAGARFG